MRWCLPIVVGVDTHAKSLTYAVLAADTGRVIDSAMFPTSPTGFSRALAWMHRRAEGRMLIAIERAGSYGAVAVIAAGIGLRASGEAAAARQAGVDSGDLLALRGGRMVTPRLRPEQIAALRCAYWGGTFVFDPTAGHAILDAEAVELGLHTIRVNGTTRVQLVPITVEAWNADRLP